MTSKVNEIKDGSFVQENPSKAIGIGNDALKEINGVAPLSKQTAFEPEKEVASTVPPVVGPVNAPVEVASVVEPVLEQPVANVETPTLNPEIPVSVPSGDPVVSAEPPVVDQPVFENAVETPVLNPEIPVSAPMVDPVAPLDDSILESPVVTTEEAPANVLEGPSLPDVEPTMPLDPVAPLDENTLESPAVTTEEAPANVLEGPSLPDVEPTMPLDPVAPLDEHALESPVVPSEEVPADNTLLSDSPVDFAPTNSLESLTGDLPDLNKNPFNINSEEVPAVLDEPNNTEALPTELPEPVEPIAAAPSAEQDDLLIGDVNDTIKNDNKEVEILIKVLSNLKQQFPVSFDEAIAELNEKKNLASISVETTETIDSMDEPSMHL